MGPDAVFGMLTPEQRAALRFEWDLFARPKQLPPPGDWRTWLILAGRGWGKTRVGAETVRRYVEQGLAKRIALVSPTAADARDVLVEGESGIMAISAPWCMPIYEPSKRRLSWPNGAVATLYTADEPDRLRGPQHDLAWCDELCAWRYPDAWDMLQFGLRLGINPRAIVTTTPKPTALLRDIMARPDSTTTKGNTFENSANLAKPALEALKAKYEGTRLGRQELYAEILDDVPGALWSRALLDKTRRKEAGFPFARAVVGVDPSGSATSSSAEAGIVSVAVAPCRCLGKEELHAFVIEDDSERASPRDVGMKAIAAYHRYQCDRVVYENNFGGQTIEDLMRLLDPRVAYRAVHASRGKIVRAEPVAALYEQGKVHHVGFFPQLEEELCTFTPAKEDRQGKLSPGRLDALVWAITDLMLGEASVKVDGPEWTPSRFTFGPGADGFDDDDD